VQSLIVGFDPANPTQQRAVCAALQGFSMIVRSLSGRVIPAAQAAEWIADTTRIRARPRVLTVRQKILRSIVGVAEGAKVDLT
jgi:hypothetical protein